MRDLQTLDFWPAEKVRFEKQIFTEEYLTEMRDYSIVFEGEPNFRDFAMMYGDMEDAISVIKPKFYDVVMSKENAVVRIAMKDVMMGY